MQSKTILIILLVLISNSACDDRRSLRQYEEIALNAEPPVKPNPHASMMMDMGQGMQTQDPAMQAMLSSSISQVNLTWETPQGWTEEKGTGMRMATFTTTDADPITCTIVSLGGGSGGVEANVQRWLGQLALDVSDQSFAQFMDKQSTLQSAGGLEVRLIDFRSLHSTNDETQPSMLAGIIERDEQTIFIKMTGSRRSINQNQEPFKSLLTSLKLTDE